MTAKDVEWYRETLDSLNASHARVTRSYVEQKARTETAERNVAIQTMKTLEAQRRVEAAEALTRQAEARLKAIERFVRYTTRGTGAEPVWAMSIRKLIREPLSDGRFVDDDWSNFKQHNHVTRDIKPEGECPACDVYHRKRG